MERPRPLAVLVMGAACCGFAALWFVLLVLTHSHDFLNLLTAAFGDDAPLEELARHRLDRGGPIRFTFALFAMQTALIGVLAWTGCALVRSWRSGRWCAIVFSVFAITASLTSTFVRLFFLTPPGEAIRVTPLLLDGLAILFANVLLGTMVLPEVKTAYAGDLEKETT